MSYAQEKSIQDGVFSVLVLRGGIAKGFAHNHLVTAKKFDAKVVFGEKPETGELKIRVPVSELQVDDPNQHQLWEKNLLALKILPESFASLSDSDRQKIKENMWSKDQLNLLAYPEISGAIQNLISDPQSIGEVQFSHSSTLNVSMVGKQVSKKVHVRWVQKDNRWNFEALSPFKFSDFGIKPYSALFGAIQNQDAFFFYVNIKVQ